MKKIYIFKAQLVLAFLFLFSVHFSSHAQSRSKMNNNARQSAIGTNVSTVLPRQGGPISTVTSCGPYTWPLTGQTFTASGIYTSNGVTQGFNNLTAWNNSVNGFNSIVATNTLGGIPNTNPINLTVGATSVSMGATNGMYTTATFVGTNTATDALTITLGPGVYGFAANIYATDIADAVTTGDITVTYSTGFVDARTVTSASEFFGYTSTTPITSVTITCANTVAPFKWPTINNLALATNPGATLDLTIENNGPVTTNFSVCQGGTVTGGLTSTLSPGIVPLPNYSGDNAGGPTYNRPTAMNQGGICANSGAGTAVQYVQHAFVAPVTGDYIFSTCGGALFDTFLALYQAPFNPAGLCAGNTLIEASDDVCGAQSTITANLTAGTAYVLVVSGFANNESGPYTVTSTTPAGPLPSVEWYTASTGGAAIATGSPFNPVGVAGSGIANTNTPGTTSFFAQFPGSACRTEAQFTITPNVTPSFAAVAPVCSGATLTALPTTSTNGVTGTWSPALNNTATTTYTFTPNVGQCATTTTLQIVVNALPTITCPANITACEGDTVNFTVTSSISSGPVTLTQNTSSVAVASAGIGCNPGGDNAFYRVYDLAALGYTSNLTLNTIKFSVQSSASDRLVTVSAYTLTGPITNANLTLLGSNTVTATTSTSIIDYTVAMGGLTVPGGSTLVLSYAVASSTNNAFIPGANAAGQSAPVFIKAVDCGIPEPTSFTTIGFPNVHVILDAELTQGGSLVQTAGLPSGSVFPVGTTTVTYVATTAAGCTATCSFDVTVNAPAPPTFTQVAPICVGGTLAALPTTSNNGVTGTWAPAIDATVTTTYTFTPDAGQCAVPTTMTIVVNPLPTVAFAANPFPVCAGSSTVLTANVTNATPTVTFGTQSAGMTTAAFGVPLTTPLSGILALAPSNGCTPFAPGLFAGKIALIQRGTCAFAIKAQNAQDAGAIGVILYNNVAGALIPAGTAPGVTIPVYGMTLADGQALIAAMTANEVNVTLNPAPPVTYLWGNGDTTQTTNTGVLNADTVFTVTVTNSLTGCTATVTVTVPVTPLTVPTFNQVAAICSGETLDPLPTSSINGVAGTWAPALNNTATTTYTFTPTPVAGQCLGTATMTITVNDPAATPTGDAVQTITAPNAGDATLEDIVVSPTTVVWYASLADAQTGTNPLPASTVLTNGATYYAVDESTACPSTPLAVTVNVTLGNDEFDNLSFMYYPNPTSSILNISYSKEISDVTVTNLLGQIVMSKKTNSTEVQIDLSPLAESTYFVTVVSEGNEKTVKVIKKD
jgi:hypothetical protein